jgi:uncharacterized protein
LRRGIALDSIASAYEPAPPAFVATASRSTASKLIASDAASGENDANKPIHEQMMDKVAAIDLEKVKTQVVDAINGLSAGNGAPNAPTPTASNKQEISLGILLHLLPAVGLMTFLPFVNLLLPLGFWLYLKRDSAYLDAHGKEVVNFHIGVALVVFLGHWLCLGWLLTIAGIILSVIGTIRASESGLYRYPLTLRLIR